MAVPQENAPIPIDRSDKIRPLRPGSQRLGRTADNSHQEVVSLSPVGILRQRLDELSPEAINKMYLPKRPAAIEERNNLLRTAELLGLD